eukprot:COSAG01_NODE_16_length_40091_cov_15.728646_47_plen_137_part_00
MSRAFPSWDRSILTEIYRCHDCSCHEIEDGHVNARAGCERSPRLAAAQTPSAAVAAVRQGRGLASAPAVKPRRHGSRFCVRTARSGWGTYLGAGRLRHSQALTSSSSSSTRWRQRRAGGWRQRWHQLWSRSECCGR